MMTQRVEMKDEEGCVRSREARFRSWKSDGLDRMWERYFLLYSFFLHQSFCLEKNAFLPSCATHMRTFLPIFITGPEKKVKSCNVGGG